MINAGLEIKSFDGFQYFDYDTGVWRGITCKINYPPKQNITANAPTVGAIVIEPVGRVWEVVKVEVVSEAKATVRLDLLLTSDTPSDMVSPALGQVTRGAIITPVNGFLAPYWDVTYVAGEISRIAAMLTMENMSEVWSGSVDLGYL